MTTVTIPFNDLLRSVRATRDELTAAYQNVLDSGWFVMGPEHNALEKELADFVGVPHAVNVANGTDALELALAALGIGPGSSVVTVANAGAYTTTATLLLGAKPVFADVDAKTLLLSAETLEQCLEQLSQVPQAIVATHLYGALCPMDEIMAIANRHGIPVVEDCAQSLGASRGGRRGGSWGALSTTSFYPTKNLGALGDGGAVFTHDAELAKSIRHMRQYGWEKKYFIQHAHGKNSRLDEIQAAILRVRLPHLDAQNELRKNIHSRYENAASDSSVSLVNRAGEDFVAHLAVLRTNDREHVQKIFESAGIRTEIHYPISDYSQHFPNFTSGVSALTNTENATKQILSLPLFPELNEEEVSRICDVLAGL